MQTSGDLAEQVVAGVVAEPIVDILEPVEVEENDGWVQHRAGPSVEGVVHAVAEQRTIGQPRERVVEGLMHELVLGLLAGGDVVHIDHDALYVRIVEKVDGPSGQPHVTVGLRNAGLSGEHAAGREQGLVEHRPCRVIIRGHEVQRAAPLGLDARMAEHRRQRRHVIHDHPFLVEEDHRVGGVGRERAVQPLTRCQSVLGIVSQAE